MTKLCQCCSKRYFCKEVDTKEECNRFKSWKNTRRKNVMIYEKDKIKRLIEYKDKIIGEQEKNDLEWILGAYNEYYAISNEIETKQKEYGIIIKKYYDAEDEKMELQDTITRLKNKYRTLRRIYRELEVKYKESCKKLKSMI